MAGARASAKRLVNLWPGLEFPKPSLTLRREAFGSSFCVVRPRSFDALPDRLNALVLQVEADGDGHALAQALIGRIDDDPQAIDEVRSELARLDGLGCELCGRRDESNLCSEKARPGSVSVLTFAARCGRTSPRSRSLT